MTRATPFSRGRRERRTFHWRGEGGVDPFRLGMIVVLLVGVATYMAFAKQLPWHDSFELKAAFENALNVKKGSPVRIAGVNVGRVRGVSKVSGIAGSPTSVVELELDEQALPIHRDATLKIRPRLFLEGNFFIDLKPGTPAAAPVKEGETLPVTQTAAPVQLDQVLTALQSGTRARLTDALDGYATGLAHRPSAAEDAGQDRAVRGRSGAEALNRALGDAPGALKGMAQANDALLGSERGDLARLVAAQGKVAGALARDEAALQDLITDFNLTAATLASHQAKLRRSVGLLGPTVEQAGKALADLDKALPATRGFARDLQPGLRELPATIDAAGPWIGQVKRLLAEPELGGLLEDLRPAVDDLAALSDEAVRLLPQLDLVDRCLLEVVLPTGNTTIQDGPASGRSPSYREFWYALVGLTGESQNFDGNGQYTRFQTGGGPYTVASGRLPGRLPDQNRYYGHALARPLGTRPAKPATQPPYRPGFACHRNTPPDLNGAAARVGEAEQTVAVAEGATGPGGDLLPGVIDRIGDILRPIADLLSQGGRR